MKVSPIDSLISLTGLGEHRGRILLYFMSRS